MNLNPGDTPDTCARRCKLFDGGIPTWRGAIFIGILVIFFTIVYVTDHDDGKKSQSSVDILFVFRDAGETNGLTPAGEMLSRNYNVKYLTWGVADELLKSSPSRVAFSRMGANTSALTQRSARLPEAALNELWSHFGKPHTPKLVVTGLVSEAQIQIASLYSSKGVSTVGFDDGFGLFSLATGGYISTALIGNAISNILVTSSIIKQEIAAALPYIGPQPPMPATNIHTVGNSGIGS